jgi:hypothetical protein
MMRALPAYLVAAALAAPTPSRAEPDRATSRNEPDRAAPATRIDPDLRMPPGTRTDAHGQLISGRGLRDTSDFLAKELARRGIAVQQVGPYGVRGVELTRFISQTPSTPWLAIHVLRTGGKTLIFLVTRPKLAPTP